MPTLERLWNVNMSDWINELNFAQTVMLTVSVFEAANYLRTFGCPLSIVRLFLLGV